MTASYMKDLNARLYRSLYRTRRVEEEVARIYPTDKIKSPIHLSIGQESVAVGVCDVLERGDVVFGTYRGHALYLAKGGDLQRMVCELFGKKTGCARGKAGSMHLVDVGAGVMGTSAIVATTVPQAVGYALAVKMRGDNTVVVCFFGDGATEEGVYHESLNFAGLKRLPILFVCENNSYAIHSHIRDRMGGQGLCERAATYGIETIRIENGDVLRIREQAGSVVSRLRAGHGGPCFMECITYRWKEHVGPAEDWSLGYRSEQELRPWQENDQIPRLGKLVEVSVRQRIESDVEAEIASSLEFADSSEFPGEEELYADVFHS